MFIMYSNKEILEMLERALASEDWEKYILLQEEADIRNI